MMSFKASGYGKVAIDVHIELAGLSNDDDECYFLYQFCRWIVTGLCISVHMKYHFTYTQIDNGRVNG